MTKSLLISSSPTNTISNAQEICPFGSAGADSAEAASQITLQEGATISRLGFNILGGGSGTNTLRRRKNSGNGNGVVAISGASLLEDLTGGDHYAATDVYNLAYTDTGTDTAGFWIRENIEFDSGHGCLYGLQTGGSTNTTNNVTRFMGIFGGFGNGGVQSTEDNVAFKMRTSGRIIALQAYAENNARTADTLIRTRVNKGNGNGLLTFPATTNGLQTHTGFVDTFVSGDVLSFSVQVPTGTEQFNVNNCIIHVKTDEPKCEVCIAKFEGLARAASATQHYVPIGGYLVDFTTWTVTSAAIKPGFYGRATNLRCYLAANTYGGAATLSLYKNGTLVMSTTITAGAANQWFENTTDYVDFGPDDGLAYEVVGGSSGSGTFHMIGMTLEDRTQRRPTLLVGGRLLGSRLF